MYWINDLSLAFLNRKHKQLVHMSTNIFVTNSAMTSHVHAYIDIHVVFPVYIQIQSITMYMFIAPPWLILLVCFSRVSKYMNLQLKNGTQWKVLNQWCVPDITTTGQYLSIFMYQAVQWTTGPLWVPVDVIITLNSVIHVVQFLFSGCYRHQPYPYLPSHPHVYIYTGPKLMLSS